MYLSHVNSEDRGRTLSLFQHILSEASHAGWLVSGDEFWPCLYPCGASYWFSLVEHLGEVTIKVCDFDGPTEGVCGDFAMVAGWMIDWLEE